MGKSFEHTESILSDICSSLSEYCNFLPSAVLSRVFTRESRMLRASLPSSGRLSVRLSVRLAVCHTRDLYQNGAS